MQEDTASQITAYYKNKQAKSKRKKKNKTHAQCTHTQKTHHQKKTQSHKMMREKEFWGEKKPHLPTFCFSDKCSSIVRMCAIFLWLLNWFLDLFLYLLPETFLIS